MPWRTAWTMLLGLLLILASGPHAMAHRPQSQAAPMAMACDGMAMQAVPAKTNTAGHGAAGHTQCGVDCPMHCGAGAIHTATPQPDRVAYRQMPMAREMAAPVGWRPRSELDPPRLLI